MSATTGIPPLDGDPSLTWSRTEIAAHVADRLTAERDRLRAQWQASAPVAHFVLDDLVPEAAALELAATFPDPATLMRRNTWRERKRVGVQVADYAPIVREFLYAFQDPAVCRAVEAITDVRGLEPDPTLYASGISTMLPGDFLRPHLDNSHDGDHRLYRALNVLFYPAPGWRPEWGGNLEVWDAHVRHPTTISSSFNRLVVMATHPTSWHSVGRVLGPSPRLCVSNYYFTADAPGGTDYTHVTTFAGRPEEPLLRAFMRVDAFALNLLGRLFPFLTKHNPHRIRDPHRTGGEG